MKSTMKRVISLLLVLCITLCLLPATALASGNITWSMDTTLTAKVNQYADAVVEQGVTVTLKYSGDPDEPTGLWITGSLTVEEGGSVGGSGILLFEKGASVTGLDLYYRAGGEVRLMKDGIQTLWDSGILKNEGDMGVFAYDAALGRWILERYTFEQDPFDKSYDAPPGAAPARDLNPATDAANRLYLLRLFKGVGTNPDGGINFDLNRPATRTEALVMLIRLLGKEAEATGGSWKHPFTDVPGWADKYVGYAYVHGLTTGSSATKFGTGTASAQMYLTFVLRALGYSDAAGGDFTWDKPEALAIQAGLLTDGIVLDTFLRADAVLVSEAALCAKIKGDTVLLLDKLIEAGVFTGSEYNATYPDSPVQRGEVQHGTTEYDREPITLATGPRNFVFTIVNVDEQTGMTELYLSDGSYSGGDWQTTDKGWVKFDITPRGLKTEFSCYTDVDFENVPDLKIRYTKRSGTATKYFGCPIKNSGRYWMDELAESLMTVK